HRHRQQPGPDQAQPDGRQGRRRGRHRRRAAGGDHRGERRAGAARRARLRDAGHQRSRLGGDPRGEGPRHGPSHSPGRLEAPRLSRGAPRSRRNITGGDLVQPTLDAATLNQLFLEARTQNGWLPTPVSDDQLRRIYDIMKMGPTSANSSPARILFVRTPEAKARLLPALSPGNVDKTKAAPVTAIIGYDTRFFEWMPKKLFTHRPEMADTFAKNPAGTEVAAFRNGTLQGAYFMLAARAVGLDVGGMSGFDNAKVDAEFFPGGRVRSNFLCNVGHGEPSKVMQRLPRLDFDEACTIL